MTHEHSHQPGQGSQSSGAPGMNDISGQWYAAEPASDMPNTGMLFFKGKLDTHKHRGQPYQTITWSQIVAMAAKPASVEKVKVRETDPEPSLPSFIPSTYHESDGRSFDVQRAKGNFILATADIDTGNPSLEQLISATASIFGLNAEVLIYSSSSAKAEFMKWRVLVLLAEGVPGEDREVMERAFFDLMREQGIECDGALARTGQTHYLPNVPPSLRGPGNAPRFYQWHHQAGVPVTLDGKHPVVVRANAIMRREREAQEAAAREAAAHRQRRRERAANGTASETERLIDWFNSNHGIEEMLLSCGYETDGRGHWQSPLQTSGSFATVVREGSTFISLSGSDRDANLGRVSAKKDCIFGDAYDLFTHFEHSGDHQAAWRAIRQMMPREEPPGGSSAGAEQKEEENAPGEDDSDLDDAILAMNMPAIAEAAFYGPLKRLVEVATENSEATKVGVAMQTIAQVGSLLRPFYVAIGDERLGLNLFMCVVGPSALGRKGTSAVAADQHIAPGIRNHVWGYSMAVEAAAARKEAIASELSRLDLKLEVLRRQRDEFRAMTLEDLEARRNRLAETRAEIEATQTQIAAWKAKCTGKPLSPDTLRDYERGISKAKAKLEELTSSAVSQEGSILNDEIALANRDATEVDYLKQIAAVEAEISGIRREDRQARPSEPWQALYAKLADPVKVMGGISSGEGIIDAIRDERTGIDRSGEPVVIPGNPQKRMLISLSEFGSVLALVRRSGSILSTVLRNAYDCQKLETNTKNEPVACEMPYISLSGAITPGELCGLLFDDKDLAASASNGIGNRPLWLYSVRTKRVADPQPSEGLPKIAEEIAENLHKVFGTLKPTEEHLACEVRLSGEAKARWEGLYLRIDAMAGDSANAQKLFGRLTTNARKLAAVLSIMNGEAEVSVAALEAAAAWVQHGAHTINAIAAKVAERQQMRRLRAAADAVVAALQQLAPDGSAIANRIVYRHLNWKAGEFKAALGFLLAQAPARVLTEDASVSARRQGVGRRSQALLRLNLKATAEAGKVGQ
jgi:hypothetical protein